jgi:hypothetical protein
MRPLLLSTSFASIVLAAGFLAPLAAQAQSPTTNPPPQTPQSQQLLHSANIPDAKLDKVAAAAKQVNTIASTYKQKLAAAPTASDKQKVVDEADGKLAKAITDQGLSVDEYESIMQVAENDPHVRDKLLDRMR